MARAGSSTVLILDGTSLTIESLAGAARDPGARVEIAAEARERLRRCRAKIDAIVERYGRDYAAHQEDETVTPVQDYGVTTGFGEFKDIPVPPEQLAELQRNLLLSHSVGIGSRAGLEDRAGCFPAEVVRATLLIRINAFLRGHSGISEALVGVLAAMFERGVVPLVPARGSLGSSGDLCPLCHLFTTLLGEGRYYLLEDEATLHPAGRLAEHLGMAIPEIGAKEGLALSNGATFSAALLALAVADAEHLARVADGAAALSLEAACGCARALDPRIHAARGQEGQKESAARMREQLRGSQLLDSAGAVQDAYSLRCSPVVHGAARDAIRYARGVAEREINAATDNPLFFENGEGEENWDWQFAENWPEGYSGKARQSFSAGNFHGEPVAMAADVLAIAVAELANIAERRVQLLLDQNHNRNLPANLVARRGVQSGLMLLQYSAASLVCENKVLAHPASVDSIPTAANIEDHVAVATTAAWKLQQVVSNVEAVLAIELITAAQAIDWRVGMGYGPRRGNGGNGPVVGTAKNLDQVEQEAKLFAAATRPEKREAIAGKLGQGSRRMYLAIRAAVEPVTYDRVLAGDVATMREVVRTSATIRS